MKYYKIIYGILFLIILGACEKEIEVEVSEEESRLVIDASLSNRINSSIVTLTKTIPLTAEQENPSVTNAEVTITDLNLGRTYRLNEVSAGIYKNNDLIGVEGHTYELEVLLADGSTYSSTQTMPNPVTLENVVYCYFDISFGDDDTTYFEIQPEFQDMADVENYYQLLIYRNGMYQNELNLFKDLGFDGLPNTQRTIIEADWGDEIICELLNLTSSSYSYLLGLDNLINQGSATPTNPISNISGGALGYFKVYTVSEPITFTLIE